MAGMSYRLSLLDKSPIPEGSNAAEALARTVLLAQRAEALGFHRFWVAEHHASPAYAGAAPEVLAAHLLARTTRIRIGSGGVMLQHYSAYKVAETFRVLEALAPGRVDLGVGKAPGGLPASTRALQRLHDAARRPAFEQQLAELDAFLGGHALPPDHALAGTGITPQPPSWPQRIVLGASPESAAEAARLGWQFCYAGHFDGDMASIERSLQTYRRLTGRPAMLALHAVVADTQAEAEQLAAGLRVLRVQLADGQRVNVPSAEAAAEFARQAGGVGYTAIEIRPQVLAGNGARVRAQLDALAARLGIEEFVVDSPVAAFAPRLRSVELLAQAVQPEALAA
jgi:luciferase family oxidoreductase group 1